MKLTEEQKAELERLRSEGYGYKKLAGVYGVTRDCIKNYCKTHKLDNPLMKGNSDCFKGVPYMETVNTHKCGATALKQYRDNNGKNTCTYLMLKCDKCGTEWRRRADSTVTTIRKTGHVRCPFCDSVKGKKAAEAEERKIKKREREKEVKEKAVQLWLNTDMTQEQIRKACSCSSDIIKEIAKENPGRFSKTCKVCGATFKTSKTNQTICSKKCNKKSTAYGDWRKRRDIEKKTFEITSMGNITLVKVIQKDNNTCYLCGGKCDAFDCWYKNDKVVCGDTYPTIDHVVPLIKGGTHTWGNVRLACKKCNTHKAMKEVGT